MADSDTLLGSQTGTPPEQPPTATASPLGAAVLRLLEAVRVQRDLPANTYAARQLALIARDREARATDLARVALSDPALVVRLIRIANSSSFETRDRSDVVSINRAIALIGHDTTRAEADGLRTVAAKNEPLEPMAALAIAEAIFAATFARNLLDTRNPMISDEGAVSTLIGHVPLILKAIHTPHEVCALRAVVRFKPALHDAFHRELFGSDESALHRNVINTWALPGTAYETVSRSRLRQSQVMSARDWLPIAVGLANEVAASVRLELHADREHALVDMVRRYATVMDIDTPRLDAMLEQAAREATDIERVAGAAGSDLYVGQLLEPTLHRSDQDGSLWRLSERLDLTGVISRVLPHPRPSIYAPRRRATLSPGAGSLPHKAIPADESLRRLEQVRNDIETFLPHYEAAETTGLYVRTERLPGEKTARVATRRERATTRLGAFVFDGLQMALGFDGVALYLHDRTAGQYHPAWIAPEPTSFDLAIDIRSDSKDLISKAANNRVDAHIANCTTNRVHDSLPEWFRTRHAHCRSFVFLPLSDPDPSHLRGFIIAERHHVDTKGLSKECMTTMQGLRDIFNQALRRAERD